MKIGRGVSELWRVENLPLPLLGPWLIQQLVLPYKLWLFLLDQTWWKNLALLTGFNAILMMSCQWLKFWTCTCSEKFMCSHVALCVFVAVADNLCFLSMHSSEIRRRQIRLTTQCHGLHLSKLCVLLVFIAAAALVIYIYICMTKTCELLMHA